MSIGTATVSGIGSNIKLARTKRWPIRPAMFVVLIVASALPVPLLYFHLHDPDRGLPAHFSFSNEVADRWTAFGGTWEVVSGSMLNESNERGAKLIAGSPYWRDYSVDADIQLLGDGDAGLVARVSNTEGGVDSYSGYYAGLRTMDDALVLGRAEHGWEEYPIKTFPGGVKPFHWYHLTLSVSGCEISAVASDSLTKQSAVITRRPLDCLPAGRIGLRSYASGGLWRNVNVRSLARQQAAHRLADPAAASGLLTVALPPPQGSASQRSLLADYVANRFEPPGALSAEGALAQAIGSLRYLSPLSSKPALIRGTVVLTAPALYVQDASGGVRIEPSGGPALKIGDEIEALGEVQPHEFSAVLRQAKTRLLWEGSPVPPLSVTASQAATGAYDATFIQTDGQLTGRMTSPDGDTILVLQQGPQEFRAKFKVGRSNSHVGRIQPGSSLRLRGICIVDPGITRNLTPFVLLVRSSEDVDVMSGPPWWAWSTLVPLGLILLAILAGAYHVYVLAKHWRLRAVVEERERLAHEIHDTLAQSFAGIGFQLQAIRNSMPPQFPVLEQQVLLACDLVRHSHEEARRSIASLRPQSLECVGLLAALQSCANKMVQHGNLKIAARCEGNPQALPLRIKDTLFRIGQEAIANTVRHAEAKSISITVSYQRSTVRLRVEDDGIGFPPDAERRGFGLVGMRKRAASISAELSIARSSEGGALLEVLAPLPAKVSLRTWPKHLWHYRKIYARSNPYSYS